METAQDRLPTPQLVLCATERAERHRVGATPGVTLASIADHLDLPFHAATSARLRPVVEELVAAGLLDPARRCGASVWDLTPAGRSRAAIAAEAVELPESPQHRRWAASRLRAEATIDDRIKEMGEVVSDVNAILAIDAMSSSDAWFAVGDRLRERARALGIAVHCLNEWPKPSDDTADLDRTDTGGASPIAFPGRRNILRSDAGRQI